jgi:outer membrane receptor protein involved in Fe transport
MGRYYRYLKENIFDTYLTAELPLDDKPDLVRKSKIGIAYQNADRQQDNLYYQLMAGRGVTYLKTQNPGADPYGLDRFDIVNIPGNPGDTLRSVQEYYSWGDFPNNSVFGKSNVKAAFAMFDYAINSTIRFSGGLRLEKAYMLTDCNIFNELKLPADDFRRKFVAPSPVLDIMIRPGTLNEISYLPSIGIIVKLRKEESTPINLRMNYSKTVARPSLRELSDNAYFDYEIDQVVYGNSLLKIVEINNYDLRLESYFKSGDNLSLSLFYKDFKNHIEMADFGQYLIWINNTNKAWVKGIELEGKKNIAEWLEFRANITLVDSRSAFNTSYTKGDGYTVNGHDIDRTMLDQAPYVINSMLTWFAKKAGLTTSVSYNLQGPRVVRTGAISEIPDIYELPRNLVDIKIVKSLNKHFTLSLKVMDVLNTPIVRAYKINNNYDLVYDQYKYGTNYVGSISYKL